jgi:hypothetical protein
LQCGSERDTQQEGSRQRVASGQRGLKIDICGLWCMLWVEY